jgi:chromosome segregation ATPase
VQLDWPSADAPTAGSSGSGGEGEAGVEVASQLDETVEATRRLIAVQARAHTLEAELSATRQRVDELSAQLTALADRCAQSEATVALAAAAAGQYEARLQELSSEAATALHLVKQLRGDKAELERKAREAAAAYDALTDAAASAAAEAARQLADVGSRLQMLVDARRSERQRMIDEIPTWLAAHHPALVRPADERRAHLEALALASTHRLHSALTEHQLKLCRDAMHGTLHTTVGDKAVDTIELDKLAADVCALCDPHSGTAHPSPVAKAADPRAGTAAMAAAPAVWDDMVAGGVRTFCTVTLARFIADGEADAAQVLASVTLLATAHDTLGSKYRAARKQAQGLEVRVAELSDRLKAAEVDIAAVELRCSLMERQGAEDVEAYTELTQQHAALEEHCTRLQRNNNELHAAVRACAGACA